MKIAIVGAGWFGCHLATRLLALGHSVRVFERNNEIFAGASGNNQNRLHLGYHYPRSARTRREIAVTHQRFIDYYPTREVKDNLFAVANESWIDLHSYLAIMRDAGLTIRLAYARDFGIAGVEQGVVLRTDELVIDTPAAKAGFARALAEYITFGVEVSLECQQGRPIVLGESYDAAIDCTSGGSTFGQPIFFEPAVLAEYDGPTEHFALTVMDGHFPCLYPTAQPGRWRVSHVMHTARGAYPDFASAKAVLDDMEPAAITNAMTDSMLQFYPDFARQFIPRYELVKAVRTKLKNNNASREYRVLTQGHVMRVFSGKICAVFLVEDEVLRWLRTL